MRMPLAFTFLLTICFSFPTLAINIPKVESKEIGKMKDDTVKVNKYFFLSEQYEEGDPLKLKYAQMALQLSEKIKWKKGIGLSYYYIAWFYFFDKNRALSRRNFIRAAEYSDDLSIKVNSYGVISNIYSWEKKHDEALDSAIKGWELVKDRDDENKIKTEALSYLRDVYLYNGNKVKERNTSLYAFDIAHREKNDDPSYDLVKLFIYVYLIDQPIDDPITVLSYIAKIKGRYEKSPALEKYKTILSLTKVTTSFMQTTQNEKIKQLQLEAEAKRRNIYVIGIIILISLLGVLIWQNILRKKVIKDLAKANEMKSRFFGILNHDLRRPVAGLITYLQFKTLAPDAVKAEDAAIFEKKTMDIAKNLLENMEDLLFWCKDQMQTFTPEFKSVAISKLFDDTRAFFNYDDKVHIIFENPLSLTIKTDENYVKTIMRNLTSNAMHITSHKDNPIIQWNAYEEDGKTILSITNNGGVISQDKIDILYNQGTDRNIKDGLGLNIIRDLSMSINCKIGISTNEIEGKTTFNLVFLS